MWTINSDPSDSWSNHWSNGEKETKKQPTMNKYKKELSEKNYSFDLLKQGLELERDELLDDSDNISLFTESIDNWYGAENLEFVVTFKDCVITITVDADVQVNRDGDYQQGTFTCHKSFISFKSHELIKKYVLSEDFLTEEELTGLENYIKF